MIHPNANNLILFELKRKTPVNTSSAPMNAEQQAAAMALAQNTLALAEARVARHVAAQAVAEAAVIAAFPSHTRAALVRDGLLPSVRTATIHGTHPQKGAPCNLEQCVHFAQSARRESGLSTSKRSAGSSAKRCSANGCAS